MRINRQKSRGSALIWTILLITILSAVAAELLQVVSSKYYSTLHTSVWQESLLAAESGVDLAIVELRKSLYPAPNNAWQAWNNAPANGVVSYGLTTVPNAGLAGTPMTIEVNVDAPSELIDPDNLWQYYRIRAVGTMPITGPVRTGDNRQDNRLRKLSLRWDRFTGNVLTSQELTAPRVSRRIEAIVRPVSAFDQAIMSVGALDLTNQGIIIDSYDSRDPAKSTSGQYDVAKRQAHGNIATDGAILNAGGARVYGDVATNAGVATGIGNITGIERTDFYQEPIPVGAPSWPSINGSPSTINNSTTSLTANSTEGHPTARYVLSELRLSGTKTLTLTGVPGTVTHIEIYVTGDIDVSGNGEITVGPDVKAKIYCAGNVSISGNGVVNTSSKPGNLLFYGINPADASITKTFNLGGNALLAAAVYAPAYNVQINDGGTRGSVFGSFVGKTVKMVGVTDLHYDEALSSGGTVNNYKIVSWFEDTR